MQTSQAPGAGFARLGVAPLPRTSPAPVSRASFPASRASAAARRSSSPAASRLSAARRSARASARASAAASDDASSSSSSSSSSSLASEAHSLDVSRTVLAIILGGGAGSRLYPLTKQRAKPAVPLGANYRLIDIPVSNCINSGVTKIYCLTQFNSASLNRHLSQAYNSNVGGYSARGFVEVLAASQTPKAKSWFQGTADAVRQYLWLFEEAVRGGVEDYLILSGDHLYRMDYSEFVAAHRATGADITVAALPCAEKEAGAFGLMKVDRRGKILEFAEKPKGEALQRMRVDTSALGLDPAEAEAKPYIASMGIYLVSAAAMHELLTDRFTDCNDFGSDIIPGARDVGMHVHAHLFEGYWADIGTIRAFYDANLGLTDAPRPAFSFYDKNAPIYTMSRFLPPCAVGGAHVGRSILGDGCIVDRGAVIEHSVIGLRSRIGRDCRIEDSLLMGADYYEQTKELYECELDDVCVPIGVGVGTHIRGTIVDKNARIGKFCKIVNVDGVEEADAEADGYVIRDGIIVIIKDSTIPDGTVI